MLNLNQHTSCIQDKISKLKVVFLIFYRKNQCKAFENKCMASLCRGTVNPTSHFVSDTFTVCFGMLYCILYHVYICQVLHFEGIYCFLTMFLERRLLICFYLFNIFIHLDSSIVTLIDLNINLTKTKVMASFFHEVLSKEVTV